MALVILVVEGFFVYRWYDRYYPSDAAVSSGAASSAADPKTAEGTASQRAQDTEDANSGANSEETTFIHKATNNNSRGDYTYLSDPHIDGDPNAVVLAAPSRDGASQGGPAYGRNIGVWFEPGKEKWAIFNQNLAPVPAGAAFEVRVPRKAERFVHRAALLNIVGNATYLDNPLVNGEPDAAVSVTQNWNPGGGRGVYNDHPVGVLYDEDVDEWFVYNKDGARIPDGAAFNVAVSGSAETAR